MNDLIGATEVAPHFGVTPDTVTAWARDGKIPTAVITLGGHRRYRLADVQDAVAAFAAEREAAKAVS